MKSNSSRIDKLEGHRARKPREDTGKVSQIIVRERLNEDGTPFVGNPDDFEECPVETIRVRDMLPEDFAAAFAAHSKRTRVDRS